MRAPATAPNTLTANVASTITSVGPAITDPNSLPIGIRASNNDTDAPIFVNYTGPGITTKGGNGFGILLFRRWQYHYQFLRADQDDGRLQRNRYLRRQRVFFFTGPQPAMVTVNATDVLTMGQFSTAISATAGGNVAVNVASGVSVMGGWQADLTSVGPASVCRPPALS